MFFYGSIHSFWAQKIEEGEKGEIGNIDGFIPQSICSALCKQCIQLESQAFHSDWLLLQVLSQIKPGSYALTAH